MCVFFRDSLEVPKTNENTSFSSSSPTKSKIIVETVKEQPKEKVKQEDVTATTNKM